MVRYLSLCAMKIGYFRTKMKKKKLNISIKMAVVSDVHDKKKSFIDNKAREF